VVRVPSVAEEDARRLHRERDRLVSERVQHVNGIKGLCALQGIYDYHPSRRHAMAQLEQLRAAQGVALPPRLTGNASPAAGRPQGEEKGPIPLGAPRPRHTHGYKLVRRVPHASKGLALDRNKTASNTRWSA
jgi:hypothetical protein